LARFTLHTIGDPARIPKDVLEETFGAAGVVLSRRARGLEAAEDGPAVGETKPRTRSISRETSFAKDTHDPVFLDGMISYLAQRATKALRRAGFLARAVGVRLRYADFQTVEARRRLRRPSDRDDEILALARSLWRARHDRRVRLRLVGVVLHDLVEVHGRQLELPFRERAGAQGEVALDVDPAASSPFARPRHERLDLAIDCVRDRHGFGSLVRGSAIGLLGRLPRSDRGFRLRTPGCSR
ncbi:MAG: hypothetical protein ACC662_04945, partial [Planctomycetota bacterium]